MAIKTSQEEMMGIPLKWIGPIAFSFPFLEQVKVPLATFETTLWPSVARGAKLSREVGGLSVNVEPAGMSRSILLEAPTAMQALSFEKRLKSEREVWQECCQNSSRFAKLIDVHSECVGSLLFIRLAFFTADAAGHNMVTKASEAILNSILTRYSELKYVSLSANYCTDKKVSSINGLLGRGYRATAEIEIPRKLCEKYLHTTPEAIEKIHVKKNLIGSILAGSLRSANAHFANMLLAFFLATGQDGANIVEGSQGMTDVKVNSKGDLLFSCVLPSLVLGTIGHGKKETLVQENLRKLGCFRSEFLPGESAKRLAAIGSAVVLCGELSLLAALTRPGELMRAHEHFERGGKALKMEA